ncbi:MAG TPA: YihY/virulence factor BrkB family protein [Actinomycetota bacterium]|nr:YihY/virulence factor BrkB family protein [Actinomycetota bacterium]
MSSANTVPETLGLTGSDARETLGTTGRARLLRDAFERTRASDGFSHARSMAFLTSLILVQGVIALVGFASVVGSGRVSHAIVGMLQDVFPGPAGVVLTDAVRQAHEAGAQHRSLALTLGLIGALITGTTLLGQIERAMNRLYGVEVDRPTVRKYGRAFVLAISAGLLAVIAFLVMTLGRSAGSLFGDPVAQDVWNVVRWPLAFAMLTGATMCVFRWSPRRRQPEWSWLALGALLSVILVLLVTMALSGFFLISSTFGQTYGPLAGFVALLLWTATTSIALLYGAAVAAQLEAVRAGVPEPRRPKRTDGTTVEPSRSDPRSQPASVTAAS